MIWQTRPLIHEYSGNLTKTVRCSPWRQLDHTFPHYLSMNSWRTHSTACTARLGPTPNAFVVHWENCYWNSRNWLCQLEGVATPVSVTSACSLRIWNNSLPSSGIYVLLCLSGSNRAGLAVYCLTDSAAAGLDRFVGRETAAGTVNLGIPLHCWHISHSHSLHLPTLSSKKKKNDVFRSIWGLRRAAAATQLSLQLAAATSPLG